MMWPRVAGATFQMYTRHLRQHRVAFHLRWTQERERPLVPAGEACLPAARCLGLGLPDEATERWRVHHPSQ
eukprot:7486106-Pyramimonas_sp.AAC.1